MEKIEKKTYNYLDEFEDFSSSENNYFINLPVVKFGSPQKKGSPKNEMDVISKMHDRAVSRFNPLETPQKPKRIPLAKRENSTTDERSCEKRPLLPSLPWAVPEVKRHKAETAPKQDCLSVIEAAKKSDLDINGIKPTLTVIAQGTYLFVCSIENDPKRVAKFFIKEHAYDYKELMTNSIANYRQALELGLPCSKIFNVDTAINDKYYLVEYIPHEIKLENEKHMVQVRKFFQVSFENKYTCDLSYSNLRVREDGTVTLIDFAENNTDFSNKGNKLRLFAINFLKSWCRKVCGKDEDVGVQGVEGVKKTDELLKYFTEGLGFEESWFEGAYTEIFGPQPVKEYYSSKI